MHTNRHNFKCFTANLSTSWFGKEDAIPVLGGDDTSQPSHLARFSALGHTDFLLMWIKTDCIQQNKYFRTEVIPRSGQRFCVSNFLQSVVNLSVFRLLSRAPQSSISIWICLKNTHNLQQGSNHAVQLFPKPYFSHGSWRALKSTSENHAMKWKSLQAYLSVPISQYWLTKPWAKPTSWAPDWF